MDLLDKYLPLIEQAGLVVMTLTLVATVVVRITPSPKDDTIVSKIAGYVLKALRWLPTIGVNPQTKKLEEAVEELGKKKK